MFLKILFTVRASISIVDIRNFVMNKIITKLILHNFYTSLGVIHSRL